MSVAFVDGPTVTEFVEDAEAFEKCVNERFDVLDVDGDGALSRDELQTRMGNLSSMEYELQPKDEINGIYDTLFEKFDADQNGTIDRDEFMALMKEIMLAKARGIGNSPVLIIVQGDSLLMRAVEHESAKNE
ncbi:hypothetical protein RJ639_014161 [Escallonia herrerae]|uniref:EF-hand domain-containing protein n=1 Tax=Escallonia herrerae TaxID=1293975 RepID=A0AA89AKW3_9ASTE|nr:hypothetical protein RJ639_014161 [Escallonia herrerae]